MSLQENDKVADDVECELIESGETLLTVSNCLDVANGTRKQYVVRIKAPSLMGSPLSTWSDACELSINDEEVESSQYQSQDGELLIIAKTQLGANHQRLSITCGVMHASISEVSLFDDILIYGQDTLVNLSSSQQTNILFAAMEQAPKLTEITMYDSWDALQDRLDQHGDSQEEVIAESEEQVDSGRLLIKRRLQQDTTDVPDSGIDIDMFEDVNAEAGSIFDSIFGGNGIFSSLTSYFKSDDPETEYVMVTNPEVPVSFVWNDEAIVADDVRIEALALDMPDVGPLLFEMDVDMTSGFTTLPVCCDYNIVIENGAKQDLELTLSSEPQIDVDEIEEIMMYETDDLSADVDEEIMQLEETIAEIDKLLDSSPVASKGNSDQESSSSSSSDSSDWVEGLLAPGPNQMVMEVAVGIGCLLLFIMSVFCLARCASRRYKQRKMDLLRRVQTSELSEDQESITRQYWILQDADANEGPVL